jgi:glucokinase
LTRSAIGADIGGTKLLAVALDADGTVTAEAKVARPDTAEEAVATLGALVQEWGGDGGVPPVGVGVACLVDRAGVLRAGPNLPGFDGYHFAARLAERTGGPVAVENDATAAAWAEQQIGAARGVADALFVAFGTGIGGAAIIGGALRHGVNGFAGEFGHMVVDPAGPLCPCGARGCWERFASGSGLAWMAARHPSGRFTSVRGEAVATAAADGDADAMEVVEELAGWIALGIGNLVAAYDPQVVVVGGGLVEMGDLLLAPVRRRLGEVTFAAASRPTVPVLAAALGERAGALGAALLARDVAAGGSALLG